MQQLLNTLRARPRLMMSAAAGLVVAVAWPVAMSPTSRALLGWNVAVWLFLTMSMLLMLRADHAGFRRIAAAQDEGAGVVLALVVLAAAASLGGVVSELLAAGKRGALHPWWHGLLAATTVIGSWAMVPTLFAMLYASRYFRKPGGGGLKFPQDDEADTLDYADFAYFSFTISVAAQTADVSVTRHAMRKLVLMHSVLSFFFNTAILAMAINLAAGLAQK